MGMIRRRKRSEIRQRLAHIVAGFVLAVHAFEKFDEHHIKSAVAFSLFALLFILYGAFHRKLHAHPIAPHLETGAFLLEAAAITITAVGFFEQGKKGIPICYSIAATAYYVQAFLQHRRNLRQPAVATH